MSWEVYYALTGELAEVIEDASPQLAGNGTVVQFIRYISNKGNTLIAIYPTSHFFIRLVQ